MRQFVQVQRGNDRKSRFRVLIELPRPIDGRFDRVPHVPDFRLEAVRQVRDQFEFEWKSVHSGRKLELVSLNQTVRKLDYYFAIFTINTSLHTYRYLIPKLRLPSSSTLLARCSGIYRSWCSNFVAKKPKRFPKFLL